MENNTPAILIDDRYYKLMEKIQEKDKKTNKILKN